MLKTLLIALTLFTVTANANIAEKIIEKYNDARGGWDEIQKIESWHLVGESTNPMTGSNDVVSFKFRGEDAFCVEQKLNDMQHVFVHNGTEGWFIAPAMQVAELTELAEPMLTSFKQSFSQQLVMVKGLFGNYKEKGLKVEFKGKEDLNGEQVNKIEIIDPNVPEDAGQNIYILFSTKDNLLKKVIITSEQGNIDIVVSEYKKVGNFTFAHSIEQIMNGQSLSKLTFTKIDINPKFDATTFAKPKI